MFFGFDTKEFKDSLKKASLADIKYQVNWSEDLLKGIRNGLISRNEDFEKDLSTFIRNCKQELKRRK